MHNIFIMIIKNAFLLACISLFVLACNTKTEKVAKPDVLAANLDTTVNPADDFFQYANGGWLKRNPIPSDEGGWGLFQVIPDETLKRLRGINEEVAKRFVNEAETALNAFANKFVSTFKFEIEDVAATN